MKGTHLDTGDTIEATIEALGSIKEGNLRTYRVHGRIIRLLHADVRAGSQEEAERLLKEAFKRGVWGPADVMTIEWPGIGLEVESEKTRKLGPDDRRMGENAHLHYKIGRAA